MARKLIEKRRRGVFGWIFLTLFWGWNLLMGASLLAGLSGNAEQYATLTSEAEKVGYAAGTGLGATMILLTWALGAVILALAAYFTRGRRELIEIDG
jgi:hypothetical protein